LTTRYYRQHGLTLSCNQPLPRLAPTTASTADISITILGPGRVPHAELTWVGRDSQGSLWRADTDDGSLLRLRYARDQEWAEFVIDEHGRNVWSGRSENVLLAEAAELLVGQVFSCVLAQRGSTCLHASVVELEGRTLAIVGPSGAGKSTTALALLQRGATFVSDDVAVLRDRDERFAVSSGAPRLRIRPDAAETLVGPFAGLEPMWVYEQRRPLKRYLDANTATNPDSPDEPTLDIICLLVQPTAACEAPELRSLAPAEALPRLMANRHTVQALDRASHARDFERLARLAETVPALELVRPEGLGSVPQTAAAIEARVRPTA
jgi:HPr Serine kinase C-terminal domain